MAQSSNAGVALPPPHSNGSAPGQLSYDYSQGNGNHMQPPSVPLLDMTHNMGSHLTGASSDSSGGLVRRAAPEPNKRALYVGGLDPRVTEEVLKQIFETTGHVQSVKIIPDKNVSATSKLF